MKSFRAKDLPLPPPGKKGWPWVHNRNPHLTIQRDGSPWPRISIVTPSYNQGQFLEETIRSVLMQGYPNLEYIVIDGGSNDNSVEIIQKYAPFLDYWISEPDHGQAHAVNKGLSRSTGAILGWLNSDDLLMPDALFHIAHAMMSHSTTKIVCGFRKVIDADSNFKRNWICDLPTDFYMLRDCVVAQETVYWKRELWEQVGPLDEAMQFALDYEYWVRLIQAGYHFRLIPHYLGMFREYETSKTSTLHMVRAANLAVIFERYKPDNNVRLINGGIVLELGTTWLSRSQVIQQLCQGHFFDSPYVAIACCHLFNLPFVQILFTLRFHYRIQRDLLRTQGKNGWWASLAALATSGFKSIHWLGKVLWSRVKLGKPLSTIEADAVLSRAEGLLQLPGEIESGTMPAPIDGIFVRSGWFYLEFRENVVWRWSERDAEIVITAPSGFYNTLYVTIARGPGYMAPTLDLQVLDSKRQPITEYSIENSATIAVPLALTANQECSIVLHMEHVAQPLANDSRILTVSVSRIAWTPPDIPQQPSPRVPQQNVRLAFDRTVEGTGWYAPEYGPDGWATWTADKESTINIWLVVGNTYDIQFRIVAVLQMQILETMVFRVNGQTVPLTMKTDNEGAFVFHGTIPAPIAALNQNSTLLTFSVDQVYSPKLLGLNDDLRLLGLKFDWLEIKSVASDTRNT